MRECELTDQQADTLRHMLGINDPSKSRPEPYRNYAAVDPGDPTFVELARLGLVHHARGPARGFPYYCYVCTDMGRRLAIESHRRIRWSKAQRRYSMFLHMRECCPDLTFRQFLTEPAFANERREA